MKKLVLLACGILSINSSLASAPKNLSCAPLIHCDVSKHCIMIGQEYEWQLYYTFKAHSTISGNHKLKRVIARANFDRYGNYKIGTNVICEYENYVEFNSMPQFLIHPKDVKNGEWVFTGGAPSPEFYFAHCKADFASKTRCALELD